jgi:hypothetical protein
MLGVVAITVVLFPVAAAAQGSGLGLGPRVTFARGSAEGPTGSQRLTGGALRLGGGRAAFEIGMDYRSEVTGPLNERVTSYPIHGSLLLFLVRSRVAPYVLGGIGWYSQRVTTDAGTGAPVAAEETTRKMGYHAGLGLELRLHRHLGVHGDYRLTRISFGGDDNGDGTRLLPGWIPGGERLKLSHDGSAFVWGATIYF